MGWLRQILDWMFVGTYTNPDEEINEADVDPLSGNRDGLGHLAAEEDDSAAD